MRARIRRNLIVVRMRARPTDALLAALMLSAGQPTGVGTPLLQVVCNEGG